MISIKTEFNNSVFNYDRTYNENIILPFNEECFIGVNELSYYKTFNIKLSHLYDNFLYIYSRCFFANSVVPTKYTGFIGVSGSKIGIYQDYSNSENFLNAGFSDIDNSKNAIVYKKDNLYYFFINCLSSINVLKYDENNNFCQACPNIISTIDPVSGKLYFQNINDIEILENKFLFVSDKKLDIVLKYDLTTYFSDENIYKNSSAPFGNNLFLIDTVGGQGSRYNSIKFELPQKIASFDNFILIEDFGNKILKLYDSNFNFLSYKTLLNVYNTISSFQNIKFRNKNEIYGISKNGYYILNLNQESYQITQNNFFTLSSILKNDEFILDIVFPKYENDILYILTNKSFIKKWIYSKSDIIGKKSVEDFGNNSEFKWISTSEKTLSSENIYIFTYNSSANANQILIYEDKLDIISKFENDDFSVYSKNDIYVNKKEWNQSWVYEKSFKKLKQNLKILKNNIYFNILKQINNEGVITDIKKIYNNFIFEEDYFNEIDETCFGVNENFQSSVINREIQKLLNIQIKDFGFVLFDDKIKYSESIYPTDPPEPSPTPTPTPTPIPSSAIIPTAGPPTPTPTATPTLTPAYIPNWILESGNWNDNNVWVDSATW